MFLYRVKVEELDAARLLTLKRDLARREPSLREHCPIREMSLVSDAGRDLDIYLALDDIIEADQLARLVGELNAALDDVRHVSSELIHI